MWESLQLDVLVVQCYAPGHSRFNPIERSWSKLTKWIVGVVLPCDLDGEIPHANDTEEWDQVLDNAVDACSRFWNGKYYNGFQVDVDTFYTNNPNIAKIKATHDLLRTFTYCSKRKLNTSPQLLELRNKYQHFVRHAIGKACQIEFIRCSNNNCDHCIGLPKRDNKFLDAIQKFGGTLPTPKNSMFFPGHYETFLEMFRSVSINPRQINKEVIDLNDEFGVCPYGCPYVFSSKADKLRHIMFMGH